MASNGQLATTASGDVSAATMESVLIGGDLSKLTPPQRVEYYRAVCRSVGLNPLTKPFEYLNLSNKLVLYARKDATDQLRKIHGVSVIEADEKIENDILIVKVKVRDREGNVDLDVGAVALGSKKGDDLANAIKKAHTQAKRRATLSICGLGWLDETETTQIQGATPVLVDEETGKIVTNIVPLQTKVENGQPAPREREKFSVEYADESNWRESMGDEADVTAAVAEYDATGTTAGETTPERLCYLMNAFAGHEERMNDWERKFYGDMLPRFTQYGERTKCSVKQFNSLENMLENINK